ncbi:ABC transporter ATP-binding protein [Streptomyces sp. NPDC005917]|uniref:ABC transporter ATP-binding protein n=1 Tax=unclassified Streptomyces TaxID=2593676 RepID=UPI0033E138C7
MPEISVHQLTQTFGDRRVLDEVTFTVPDGQFVTLLGPSGCGKTTTLMAVAGFHTPTSGRIRHGERVLFDHTVRRNTPAEQRELGVVFQSYALWPHMTVHQNVAFPLKLRGTGKAETVRRVGEVLELVELAERAGSYPHELSGGQQQRVALARALAHSPSALLLDEPFSNLDAKLRERARDWLTGLQRDLGITTVFVTHDQTEALAMSDLIMVMEQGRIVRSGTPEDVYRRPGNRFTAEFLGRCNFLTGTARRAGEDTWALEVPGLPAGVPFRGTTALASGTVTLAIRPEALTLSEPGPGPEPDPGPRLGSSGPTWLADADVIQCVFLGDHYLYTLRIGPHELQALSTRRIPTATVRITLDSGAASPVGDHDGGETTDGPAPRASVPALDNVL